jgi:CHAT domain-containing protein
VLDAQADTLAALRRNLDADGQALLDKLKRLRRQEAQLRSANPADTKAQREDLAKAIQETEHGIATRSKAFAAQNQEVTIAGVQEALPKGTALLQYAIYTPKLASNADDSDTPPHLGAYLLHADGRLSGVNLGPLPTIQRRLEPFRLTQDPTLSQQLYTKLIAPVLSEPAALSHLFISPDGLLNLIPFEALQDDTGTPLLETVNISYLSTGRDLLRIGLHDDVETSVPVVFADPDFGPGILEQLDGTGTEADMLAKRFPKATIYRGADATTQALKAIDSPEFLHIATHGFALENDPHTLVDNNPMTRSGLVLAGGNDPDRTDTRLRASEAVTLDLDGTRLVVLSACESGLGQAENGEGIYGMRRALTLAGAASQVVSLWEVSDEATAVFMDGFYGRVQAGEPLGEALRTTKREMRASEDWGETKYWAPFVLAGDWR